MLDELENEYATMVKILSGNGQDEIIDCARLANGGKNPVTFADIHVDAAGNIVPREIALTDPGDHMTCQSLDYIFIIKKRGLKSKEGPKDKDINSVTVKSKEEVVDDTF